METVSQGPGSRAGWAGTETSEAGAGAGAGDPSWHNERSSSFVNQGRRTGGGNRNYNYFTASKYFIIHLQQLF